MKFNITDIVYDYQGTEYIVIDYRMEKLPESDGARVNDIMYDLYSKNGTSREWEKELYTKQEYRTMTLKKILS